MQFVRMRQTISDSGPSEGRMVLWKNRLMCTHVRLAKLMDTFFTVLIRTSGARILRGDAHCKYTNLLWKDNGPCIFKINLTRMCTPFHALVPSSPSHLASFVSQRRRGSMHCATSRAFACPSSPTSNILVALDWSLSSRQKISIFSSLNLDTKIDLFLAGLPNPRFPARSRRRQLARPQLPLRQRPNR